MRYSVALLFALLMSWGASAQKIAVKTNLLYDATATVNLGVEIGLGSRTTLDLSGNYNAWDIDHQTNQKARHALLQPEFRYYFCEKFNRHFVGVHALFTEYNVCGGNWLLNGMINTSSLKGDLYKESRYQGVGYGAGVAYGYDLMLSNRFNLEFSAGVGYMRLDYDRYGAPHCAPYLASEKSNYWGITKLGISLVYIIK